MTRWKFLRSQSGVALIEFALALPLLLLLLFGGLELARYILIHQKLDRATNAMDDLATQQANISDDSLGDLTDAMPKFMRPYSWRGGDILIFTFVGRQDTPGQPPSPPKVSNQFSAMPGGISKSKIGGVGSNASLPNGFTMINGESVVVAESFYQFTPLVGEMFIDASEIYKVAVMRPRFTDNAQCPVGCTTNPSEPTVPGCFPRPTCPPPPPPPCGRRCSDGSIPPDCDLTQCPCQECLNPGEPPNPLCGGTVPETCPDCPCLHEGELPNPDCVPPQRACRCYEDCQPLTVPRDPACPVVPNCCYPCYYPGQPRESQCLDRPECGPPPEQCPLCPDGVTPQGGSPPNCTTATCPHQ